MRFFVQGEPVPKGSTHAFKHKTTGAVITMATNAKAQKGWRERIYPEAKRAITHVAQGAVRVELLFLFNRPKGHYGKKGLLPSAPAHKTTKPDLDKLVRCVLDALTGVGYKDDAQVVYLMAEKTYTDVAAGAWIEVIDLEADFAGPKPYPEPEEGPTT